MTHEGDGFGVAEAYGIRVQADARKRALQRDRRADEARRAVSAAALKERCIGGLPRLHAPALPTLIVPSSHENAGLG